MHLERMQNEEKHDGMIIFKNGLDTMKIFESNQKYECAICDNDFLSPVQLTIHCIVEHRLHPCVECLKLFGNENQLKQHKQRSCVHKNYTCTKCSIVFPNETITFEHMIEEHSERKCHLCTANISNENFSEHIRYTHRANEVTSAAILKPSNQTKFCCNLCEKDMNLEKFISHYIFLHKCSIESLIRIIFDSYGQAIFPLESLKTIDENRDGTKCSVCKANFTFSIPKIFHNVYCFGLNYCATCNSCLSNEQINNHKHNEEEKIAKLLNYPFNCDLCGVDLKSIENNLEALIEHFRISHNFNDKMILGSIKKIERISNHRKTGYTESIETQPNDTYYSEIRSNQNINCEQKIISFDTKLVKYLYSSESDYDSPEEADDRSARMIQQRYCDFCKFSSKSKYVFARHLHEKHGFLLKNPCFDCGPCKKTFTINRNLQQHLKKVHHKQISINDKRYKCSFCDYASNCKQKMRIHIRDHVESSYHPCNDRAIGFNCKYCHFIFWTREKLSDHVLNRHSENINESYLLCNICVATFTNLATFRQHSAFRHVNYHQPGTGVFQCSICRLAYPSIECIRCHMNEAHPMLTARYCSAEYCMQIIGDDQQLKSHWSDKHTHTNSINSNTLFQCTDCFKLFEKHEFVFKHWQQVHSNAKKIKNEINPI